MGLIQFNFINSKEENNMSKFAERLKAINRQVIEREKNPNIEEWKKE